MIDEIRVENLALIKEASLVVGRGLTVLTGETGAGKTALLSALKLLMGERADASFVREGADSLRVEGRFYRDDEDPEGFSVVRTVSADGRSRVKIDGSISSVRELSACVRPLVELCGQHEHQRLLDSSFHTDMVDRWAGDAVSEARDVYRAAWDARKAAAAELERIEAAARLQGEQVEEARFRMERISEVDPRPGEIEELEEVLPRAEHAEALARCAHDAQSVLSDEGGALDALNSAIAELSRMGRVDAALGSYADSLSEASIIIEDAAASLRSYRDGIEFDPSELERMQERLAQLKGLMRRYGPTMDDVFSRYQEAAELLGLVDDADGRLQAARAACDACEHELVAAAKELMKRRGSAGPRFCREVMRQMQRLEMPGSELVWDQRPLPRERWTAAGPATCELLYRSGAGLTPRPLKRIASGGELSRVLLATKVVLGSSDQSSTLVFDEVDAGVGGATARSLAAVLADLARTHQVVVVTHLPQIAVAASHHYVVSKHVGEVGVPMTTLELVEGDERVSEIARMLSGERSEASLAHARSLLGWD